MTNSAGKGDRQKLHPPFAQPDPGRRATPAHADAAEVSPSIDIEPPAQVETAIVKASQLPPIEEFVDELPSIEEFVLTSPERSHATPPLTEVENEGWASGTWQSYDWGKVAALGAQPPEVVEANAAWSSTDWDSASQRPADVGGQFAGPPAAQVAAALEEMARRIRSGELSLEKFYGTPPEAAVAAVFAALLRARV